MKFVEFTFFPSNYFINNNKSINNNGIIIEKIRHLLTKFWLNIMRNDTISDTLVRIVTSVLFSALFLLVTIVFLS